MGGPQPPIPSPNPVDSLAYLRAAHSGVRPRGGPSGSRPSPLAHPPAAPGSEASASGAPRAIAALRARLERAGAKPCHVAAVLRAWTHALPLDAGVRPAESFLPGTLRAALPALSGD